MEPANIDWKTLDSRFVRDEAYENINAPMWLDLAAPDSLAVDDDAWFCRSDCKHPKTAEDFKLSPSSPSPKAKLMRSSSERLPLGQRNSDRWDENNLRRRGGIAAALLRPASPLRPKAAPSRKVREDLENQDPNLTTPPRPARPLGATLKGRNTAKEAIKSSAEKKKVEEELEEPRQKRAQPRLKSTLSARNLFSGRDILSQISEFCHELKKMAVGRTQPGGEARGEARKTELKVADILHKEEAEDRKLLTPKKDDAAKKSTTKMAVKKELDKSRPLKEVRASPPTPQRFPSPSNRSLKNPKATPNDRSPLGKPPKSTTLGRAILQEVEPNKVEEKKALLAGMDDDCRSATDDADGSSADLFWFLKPCTYLV